MAGFAKKMVKCRHAFKTVTTFDANGNPIVGPFERPFSEEVFGLLTSVVFNHVTYPRGGWVQIADEETLAKQKAAAADLQKAAAADSSINSELIDKIEAQFYEKEPNLEGIELKYFQQYAEAKGFNYSKGPKSKVFESLKEQYEAA